MSSGHIVPHYYLSSLMRRKFSARNFVGPTDDNFMIFRTRSCVFEF